MHHGSRLLGILDKKMEVYILYLNMHTRKVLEMIHYYIFSGVASGRERRYMVEPQVDNSVKG